MSIVDYWHKKLKKDGFSDILVRNKRTKRFSLVLDENVTDAKNPKRKLVIFRVLEGDFGLFAMERNEFADSFEKDFCEEAVEKLLDYFKINKNG